MATTVKQTESLILLPMPLDPIQTKRIRQFLTEKLKEFPLEQIVMQEIYKIYSWKSMKKSPTKRLYRNYSLAYSLLELKTLLLSSYNDILKPD